MSNIIDKFGRGHHINAPVTSDKKLQIPYTQNGDYNFENKKLTNVSDPVSDVDAVNKKYVDENLKLAADNVQRQYVAKQASFKNMLDQERNLTNKILRKEIDAKVDLIKSEIKVKFDNVNNILNSTNAAYKNTLKIINAIENTKLPQLKGRQDTIETNYNTLITNSAIETGKLNALKNTVEDLKTAINKLKTFH